jgi:hypothetical protein
VATFCRGSLARMPCPPMPGRRRSWRPPHRSLLLILRFIYLYNLRDSLPHVLLKTSGEEPCVRTAARHRRAGAVRCAKEQVGARAVWPSKGRLGKEFAARVRARAQRGSLAGFNSGPGQGYSCAIPNQFYELASAPAFSLERHPHLASLFFCTQNSA